MFDVRSTFIVTTPIRNEEWILEKFLATTSLWADHILIADTGCTDRSLEICKQFPKVTVLPYQSIYHESENIYRRDLFFYVRKINPQAIVFALDADEILSSEVLTSEVQKNIQTTLHAPGNSIEIPWIMLWKNPLKYRTEQHGLWSNRWIRCIYWDDGHSDYPHHEFMHTPRVSSCFISKKNRLNLPLLHYQYVGWKRNECKQAYYRIWNWEKSKKRWFEPIIINLLYATTRESFDAKTTDISPLWISEYENKGIDLHTIPDEIYPWFVTSIFLKFSKNSPSSYSWLDIWDISWKEIQKHTPASSPLLSMQSIEDPRNFLQKIFHLFIHCAGRYGTRIGFRIYLLSLFLFEKLKKNRNI